MFEHNGCKIYTNKIDTYFEMKIEKDLFKIPIGFLRIPRRKYKFVCDSFPLILQDVYCKGALSEINKMKNFIEKSESF